MSQRTTELWAVVLAMIMVASVVVVTAPISGPVAAEASGLTVDEDAVPSDGTITVNGDISDENNNVTFLVQDPVDEDVATVTKSVDTDFSVDIDLSNLTFGGGDSSLDEGDVTILADEGRDFDGAEASATVIVDDTKPTASLDNPTEGAELTDHPLIDGTASDDTAVATVEVTVQNSSGYYYDGGSFVDEKTWVEATGTTSWEYNTTDAGISTDGEYDVSIRVTDTAGNTRDVTIPHPEGEATEVSYEVDSTPPTIDSVKATDGTDGDGTIEDGDSVNVTASVTDETSGVDTVTVDASPLGGAENKGLSADSGNTYTTTFEVDSPTAGDGTVDLDVTATDAFGNEQTDNDTLDLETNVAGVGELTVDKEFVGIVHDEEELTVSAREITDPQGKQITGPTNVTVRIAGTETTYEATVEDGSLETTIDPTAVTDTAATGEATVEIAGTVTDADTAKVELVHEAKDLHKGFQAMGTPMPAERLVVEDVKDVLTYDPTAEGDESEWKLPDGTQSGEGYYVEGRSDDARIGYVFDMSIDEGVEARTLHDGWNLVGTSIDLTEDESHAATNDLGGAVDVNSNDNVEVYVRTDSDLDQADGETGYKSVDGNTDVSSFEGYFVYVEDGTEVRNVDIIAYVAGDRA
ncbi:Uncharacterized protein HSBGL_1234 [Halapricum desulfuricans]|uniref:Uncharacterized protein n=1 Tax=Halapricum desulfuricans TaxID=2841257 RepID=A0A897NG26_9EURY|nr:Ig-like domain-containing protein [Halapricum desulfuricans]QSG11657.1 Uncharacterized protein HSBGL_1234 [Halapricum desulfuricans]